MRIVALDPGKQHFAYAVVETGRCVRHGHVRTVQDMNYRQVASQTDRFYHDIYNVLGDAGGCMAFERMQHRPGMGGGAVVEYVNVMIGIAMAMAYRAGMTVYPVLPVTWKTRLAKQLGIERGRFTTIGQKLTMKLPPGGKHKTRLEFVAGVFDQQPRARDMTPHEGDAVAIGCYVWECLTGESIVERALI